MDKCSVCGKDITGEFGNNPEPFRFHGRCCDSCNETLVIPIRLFLSGYYKNNAMKLTEGDGISFTHPSGDKAHQFTLEELQKLVGGYIELLPSSIIPESFKDKFYFVVDEEGKLKGATFNKLAFELFNVAVAGTLLVVPKGLIE